MCIRDRGRTYGLTVRAEGTTTVAGSTISGQSNGQLTVELFMTLTTNGDC